MRNSIKRGALVLAGIVLLSTPVLADAPRGNHVKQSNPTYWEPALRDNTNAAVTNARRAAARQQVLPRLPVPAQSKAPVNYGDVEFLP